MEDDAGGSSQDQYESDFINDDGREQIDADKARRLKKGQLDTDEEEEFMNHDKPSKKHQSKKKPSAPAVVSKAKSKVIEESEKEEEDESDPYDKLELAQGQEEGGFKYCSEEKEYLLANYFFLPAKIYEALFEH